MSMWTIVQVALPVCLGDTFDYTVAASVPTLQLGCGAFGRRTMVGVVFGYSAHATAPLDKIKNIITVLDTVLLFRSRP